MKEAFSPSLKKLNGALDIFMSFFSIVGVNLGKVCSN